MKRIFATMLMALVSFGSVAGGRMFACNINALTKSERAAHRELTRTLLATVEETRELRGGYAFRLPSQALPTAAQWVMLEGKCCPFFTFELEVARNNGPLWLHVTGSPGVKEFMREEFRLNPNP